MINLEIYQLHIIAIIPLIKLLENDINIKQKRKRFAIVYNYELK